MNKITEIKKEIRKLHKLIKDFKPKSKERKEIKQRILDLKEQIKELERFKGEKKPIIEQILLLDKEMAKLNIDLYKHSDGDLKKYLLQTLTKRFKNVILN